MSDYRWLRGSEGKWFMGPSHSVGEGTVGGEPVNLRRQWGGSIGAIRLALGDRTADEIVAKCDEAAARGEYLEKWPV